GDRPAPLVVVERGRLVTDVSPRDPADDRSVRDVEKGRLAADLEAAVRELVLVDDDRHPWVTSEVLQLAVGGGHPDGEPAVLPEIHERRQEDRPVGSKGGHDAKPALVEEHVQLLDGETAVHPGILSAERSTIRRWQRRRGPNRSSSRAIASASNRSGQTTSTTLRGSPSTRRCGAGRAWAGRTRCACGPGWTGAAP